MVTLHLEVVVSRDISELSVCLTGCLDDVVDWAGLGWFPVI